MHLSTMVCVTDWSSGMRKGDPKTPAPDPALLPRPCSTLAAPQTVRATTFLHTRKSLHCAQNLQAHFLRQ